MKKKKIFVNIYLSVWMLYYLQNLLGFGASFVSRILALFILLVSFYYTFYALTKMSLPKPFKVLAVLLAFWSIYGLAMILQQKSAGVSSFNYIKDIYLSFFPIYTLYVFSRKKWLTSEMLFYWTFVFVLVTIATFYYSQLYRSELLGKEEITNNQGYTFVSILPLLFLIKKKPIAQFALLSVCSYYVIIGMKRGAIICAIVCFLWLVLYSLKREQGQNRKEHRNNILRFILIVFVVVGVVGTIQQMMLTSDYFIYRIDQTLEGDSSGRDYLYTIMWNHFMEEPNVFRFLFGNGGCATVFLFDGYAHNDWLEIAIDNGAVMLVIYALYWISLFKMFLKGKKNSVEKMMLGMFVFIYFVKTLISMSYSTITIFAACAMGYAMANYEYDNIKN